MLRRRAALASLAGLVFIVEFFLPGAFARRLVRPAGYMASPVDQTQSNHERVSQLVQALAY
jgi:hypothetical protein